jgi:hypothetical protein
LADAHFYLADLLQDDASQRAAAIAHLQAALRLEPGHEEARQLLKKLRSAP